METLVSPKTNYLLNAGVDVLHFESREWLSELEFLKHELGFFMKLLNSRVFALSKEDQRQSIYTRTDKLRNLLAKEAEKEVTLHEKDLAALLTNKNHDDTSYRERHKQLKTKIDLLDKDVKTLKMQVFDFVEHLK